jgi:anionic cell wall polymer biosynthesis LytR-Cps2A-Psr (LCP) family protein
MRKYFLKINNKKLIFSGSILVLIICSLFLNGQSKIVRNIHRGERINLLLLECNSEKRSEYYGTVLLLSYHPVRRFLDVVTIPSATKIKKSSLKKSKLGTIYSNICRNEKDRKKAVRTLKKKVEEILEITIPFYMQIETEEFMRVIDLLGGIKRVGKKHVILGGKEFLEDFYQREEGDYQRLVRQQNLLKEMIKKFKWVPNLFKIPQIIKENMVTNLTLGDIWAMCYEIKKVSLGNIRFQNLPGTLRKREPYYWIMDKEKVGQMVEVIFSPGNRETKVGKRLPAIAVWNAAGIKGMAREMRTKLKYAGMDVVRWGNYATLEECTVVIDKAGNFFLAGKIAKIINCDKIISQKENFPLEDISIIIGEDFIQ